MKQGKHSYSSSSDDDDDVVEDDDVVVEKTHTIGTGDDTIEVSEAVYNVIKGSHELALAKRCELLSVQARADDEFTVFGRINGPLTADELLEVLKDVTVIDAETYDAREVATSPTGASASSTSSASKSLAALVVGRESPSVSDNDPLKRRRPPGRKPGKDTPEDIRQKNVNKRRNSGAKRKLQTKPTKAGKRTRHNN